jgi:hypothetical protein
MTNRVRSAASPGSGTRPPTRRSSGSVVETSTSTTHGRSAHEPHQPTDGTTSETRCALSLLPSSTRLPEEPCAQFGWGWETVEEEGIGPTSYCPLAWDGTSRFLLSSSGFYPQAGVNLEAGEQDDIAGRPAELWTATR